MKVRILRNLGRGFPAGKEGEITSLSEEEATALIAHGLAVAVDAKGNAKEFKGIPPEPELVSPEAISEFNAVIDTVKNKK